MRDHHEDCPGYSGRVCICGLLERLDNTERERDRIRAELEQTKTELDGAKAQARYYRMLYDFETCTGCADPECGLCGPLNTTPSR